MVHIDLDDLSGLTRHQDITLYARIFHTQGDYVAAAPPGPMNKVQAAHTSIEYLYRS